METHQQTCPCTRTINRFGVRLLVAPIRFYQYILSPWLGQHCRFHPTCSQYALEALHEHGATQGLWLALRRLSKCHPWHMGGYDPVPLNPNNQHKMVNK